MPIPRPSDEVRRPASHRAVPAPDRIPPAGHEPGRTPGRDRSPDAPSLDPTAGASEIDGLLDRMRSDDREAAAAFITRYGSRIRRRIRGKLSPDMRRIFDSQDILSTVGRRLDLYVRSGRLEVESEAQLWALVFRMANNAVIDKARVFRRLQAVEEEDGPFAHALNSRLREAERRASDGAAVEIERVVASMPSPTDRDILRLWLTGIAHPEIAEYVDLTPAAVRKRWQRIRNELRERYAPEDSGWPPTDSRSIST